MLTKITDGVAGGLATIQDPRAKTAAKILPIAVKTWGKLIQLDKDDKLGELPEDIAVATLNPSNQDRTWAVKGSWAADGWAASPTGTTSSATASPPPESERRLRGGTSGRVGAPCTPARQSFVVRGRCSAGAARRQ
jgi:hypothetical protein